MAQQGATSSSHASSSSFSPTTKRHPLFKYNKSILIVIWLATASQLIHTNLSTILSSWSSSPLPTLPAHKQDAISANNLMATTNNEQHQQQDQNRNQRQDSSSLVEQILAWASVQLGSQVDEGAQQWKYPSRSFGVLFAEAGKKKKKEKSEVVVISVQNPPAKGHGMYPVFIPSCGGHGHGYGRRKRRSIAYT